MMRQEVLPSLIGRFFTRGALGRLFELNIAKKMLFGYLLYIPLMILIVLLILSRVEKLNMINNSIIQRDISLAEISNKMIDNLLAQELYGRRAIILGSPEMSALFWERNKEFSHLIQQLGAPLHGQDIPVDHLMNLHIEHSNLFRWAFYNLKNPSPSVTKRMDQEIKERQEGLIQLFGNASKSKRKKPFNLQQSCGICLEPNRPQPF